MTKQTFKTQDFDFHLPSHLIAQHPTSKRSDSRLLQLDGCSGLLLDSQFSELVHRLNKNDVLVFNDTRVIKARMFGEKSTGGVVEVMIDRIVDDQNAIAHVRASRSPKIGSLLTLADKIEAEVTGRDENLFHLKFLGSQPILELLEQHGSLPLPPYISHDATEDDESRYQTVFAKHAGAVAAPTAGLHFDDEIITKIKRKGIEVVYITLHVGAGTFQPVKVDNITDHKMHSELCTVPEETVMRIEAARKKGGKVTAVGTTALRALESAAQYGELTAGNMDTNIFITPGYDFKVVDRLLTNFHLPKSTLLMLVSAFAGFENIKHSYRHAINQEYRFFSYGDAMLLEKKINDVK